MVQRRRMRNEKRRGKRTLGFHSLFNIAEAKDFHPLRLSRRIQQFSYGYYPKPSKSWLVVKEEHYEKAKEMFKDVQITTKGQRYLGSFIGTNEGKEEFILEKCKEWTEEIEGLASIALHEPQLAYCAFTLGSSCRWSFLMRTTPNISQLLGPIEEKIRHTLIPNITGRMLQSDERALFALPARLGGLAFTNPVEVAVFLKIVFLTPTLYWLIDI